MPRGRPPKNRTREEAVNARREQVRKNVQAFRERKRLQQQHKEVAGPAESEGISKGDDQARSKDKCNDSIFEDQQDVVEGHDGNAVSGKADLKSDLNLLNNNRSLAPWSGMPPGIRYPQLSRQQFVSNCVAAFKPESKLNTGPHWTETLPEIVNKDSILDFAIQAICLVQLGNVTSQRWLLEEGSNYYGRALRTLTCRLPTDRNIREEVFMAMMALSCYEVLQGTDIKGQGWLIHYKAAFRYLKQLSQANNGWVPNNQPVFHFLETLCVFDAVGSRKSNYFSTSEAWFRTLDRWGGETYGPLLGLITSVPVLLETHDKLLNPDATTTPSFSSKSELLNQCFRLEDHFLEWHHQTSSHLHSFTFTISETSQGDMRLMFPTLFAARLHLLYWSALVLLLDTIASLFRSMHTDSSDSGFDKQPLSTPFMLQDILSKSQEYALYIHQSVAFCLNPENGVVGRSLVLLPLCIVRDHFQEVGDSARMERCNDILSALGQRDVNFRLAGHVTDEGESLTGVHWREGGLASLDRGRKELANLGAYCL